MSKITKTYYYTYIVRHINGKYYVGRRSTKKDPLLDPYMGSGKWVKSIKDRSTLTKTIIAYCDTFDELKIDEMELIEKYFGDEYCMNVMYSSCGAASGDKHHMYGKTGELNHRFGSTHTEDARQKISEARFGTVHTEETKQKMSDAKSGDKNPMFGKTGELSPIYGDKNVMHRRTGELHPSFGKRGELSHMYGIKLSDKTKKIMSEQRSGEKAYNASITDHIARLIKIRISEGVKDRPIAEEYNTTPSVVSGIRHNRTWKHVTI